MEEFNLGVTQSFTEQRFMDSSIYHQYFCERQIKIKKNQISHIIVYRKTCKIRKDCTQQLCVLCIFAPLREILRINSFANYIRNSLDSITLYCQYRKLFGKEGGKSRRPYVADHYCAAVSLRPCKACRDVA